MKKRTTCRIPTEPKPDLVKPEFITDEDFRLSKRFLSTTTQIECYNFTGHVVKTLDHMGVCCIHQPITTTPDSPEFIGCFVIRKRYELGERTLISRSHDTEAMELSEREEGYIDEVMTKINRKRGMSRRCVSHYLKVRHRDLLAAGGLMYVRVPDLVIIDESFGGIAIHPNSKKYLNMQLEHLQAQSHIYSIEINDSAGEGQPYYVNLNGKVFTINPTKDINFADGVKIIYKEPNLPARVVHRSSLVDEELKNIGVFKNYRDADQYGKKFDLELARLENETALAKAHADEVSAKNKLLIDEQTTENKMNEILLKMNLITQQSVAEIEKHNADQLKNQQTIEKLQAELVIQREEHQRSLESMRMKDYYDYRAYERKDSSELVKFFPVLLGAGLAAFAILKRG